MLVPFRVRPFATLLAFWLTASAGDCPGTHSPLSLRIRVVGDTVRLRRFPEGVSLDANVIVRNRESHPVYIVGCWPSAERDIDGTWTEVFRPACLQGRTLELAPADSAFIPVSLQGFTATNMLPRLDPRAEPGRYRLVFWASAASPDPSTGIASPSSAKRVTSEPFIVGN